MAVVTMLSRPALAQDSSSQPGPSRTLTTLTGVYTEQQASRGESIYRTM